MRVQNQTLFTVAESSSGGGGFVFHSSRRRRCPSAAARRSAARTPSTSISGLSTAPSSSRKPHGAGETLISLYQQQGWCKDCSRPREGVVSRYSRSSSEDETGEDAGSADGLLDVSILSSTKWDVPWGGKVLAVGFLVWIFLFLGIGLVVAPALASYFHLNFADAGGPADDKAYFLLLDQTCELVAGLGLIWVITRPYSPLPKDLFKISIEKPFNKRDGWLLWGLIGIASGFVGVGVTAYLLSLLKSDGPQSMGTADAVVSILSKDPKVFLSLFTVTSIMAPLLEEVIFRGFLLTTLTKWLPAPTAAFVSAGIFGAAHLTSRDFAQLTALGVVLGLTYTRTKNLSTPILIHSFWNSGVLIFLEILFLAGYDVSELLK